jgi:hypothetical protein
MKSNRNPQDIPPPLLTHGVEVFGTKKKVLNWLYKENFFFDKKAPAELLSTANGIKFIDDRLTCLEFGQIPKTMINVETQHLRL